MKEKIRKLLFEYTRNSRITTKELGKRAGVSQQSASYLKNQLKNKKYIQPTTIVDAVKLGYVNVLVGFNFLRPESSLKKEIIGELNESSSIIKIEEGSEGLDLLVLYSVSNLSAFNKSHTEITHKFYKKLKTMFVFPVIVIHEYLRNYLVRKFQDDDTILSGDRNLKDLSKNELKILNQLIRFPDKKLVDISVSLKIPIKSVIKIKKLLEKKFVIKGYSSILNNSKLGINRQVIFLKFSGEVVDETDKFTEYARRNKEIVQLTKVIGDYQVVVFVESLKEIEIIKAIRSEFSIENYLIFKSDKIHKWKYLPGSAV